jgi:hypothetical protein
VKQRGEVVREAARRSRPTHAATQVEAGALSYDADGSKHKIAPVAFVHLDSNLHITHGDFLVI